MVLIFVLIRLTTRSVARSVAELSAVAGRIENGDFTSTLPEVRTDEIGHLNRSFNQMIEGLHQRDVIQGIFGRYMDQSIAEELLKQSELLRMGGEERVVTMLMADLKGFTEIAENCLPEQVIGTLNEYLAAMIEVIACHKGVIVDFFGAGILAFFNGMTSSTQQRAEDSVKCALEMRSRFQRLQDEVEGLHMVGLTVGIHTGKVIVGNIGSETRTKYGVVGSAVNTAERIKSCASGGSILVSEETYRTLGQRLKVGPKVRAVLKGLEHSRDLYPVTGIDGEAVDR
jgi:sigma-B regulation protein RsbU (phosphoserine phosphatase)